VRVAPHLLSGFVVGETAQPDRSICNGKSASRKLSISCAQLALVIHLYDKNLHAPLAVTRVRPVTGGAGSLPIITL